MSAEGGRPAYASGDYEIDFARRELRMRGVAAALGGRAFEIIEILARSRGELVTKDELIKRIWPGSVVLDNTLQVHVTAIRKALGPHRGLLKTESGRGYRLLGDWVFRHHNPMSVPSGIVPVSVTAVAPEGNFPASGPLIGRATAIRQLRDLLSAYRVVTLTGPGGIGKTTLAIEVARCLLEEFEDGGKLVELASVVDPARVPSAVARALELKLAGEELSAELVAQAIGARKLLLLLDNCEHVIDAAAALVETLVRLCPHVTTLVTSRETLQIEGECVYRVPPLDVPADVRRDRDHILAHSAVELFVARAESQGSENASRSDILPTVAAICRHLDGIPLAIEFAAARAAVLGIEEVAESLRDRFAVLTRGRRTAARRHQTLRATLDWSYELLNEAERDLLRRLAIFAGPFSLDAACAVAVDGTNRTEIADGVAGLVGKSLIFRTTDPVAGEFRLLETTRAYALDRLTESGALGAVARCHAVYFLNVLARLNSERQPKPASDDLVAFRHCADDVHAALDWAFSDTGDPVIGLTLTLAAEPLWFGLFQLAPARGRLEQALSHADAGSDVEMRLRIALGRVLWYSAPDGDAVEPAFARALEIARQADAVDVQVQALWGIWAARRGHADYDGALDAAQRYAEVAARAGNAGAIHLGDRIVGLTHELMGHQAIAREFVERALRQADRFDPASGIGFQVETPAAMGAWLARILWLSGFPDQAKAAANQAVAAAANGGNSFSLCYAISVGGLPVALWTGDRSEARRMFDSFVGHAGGIPRMEPRVPAFARVLQLRDGDDAEVLIASFIEAYGDPALIYPSASFDFSLTNGVPMPRDEPIAMTWSTPEALRVDAELLLWHAAPGAVAAAEAKLLCAMQIAREQSALSWELRAAMSLGRLWRRHGRAAEAHALLARTYGNFTEGFGTSDLIRARHEIALLE